MGDSQRLAALPERKTLAPKLQNLIRIDVDRHAFAALSCSLPQELQETFKHRNHTLEF